jgi:hypothetical protein
MTHEIDFDEAVSQAKVIAQDKNENYLALGQLGATVKPVYKAKTLSKLANEAGINYASPRSYTATWKASSDAKFVGRPTYSLLKTLINHPDRVKIISDKPDMKVSEARKLMREYKKATAPKPKETPTQRLEVAWSKFERSIEPFMSGVSEKTVNAFGAMQDAINNFKSVLALDLNEKIEPDDDPEPVDPAPNIQPAPMPEKDKEYHQVNTESRAKSKTKQNDKFDLEDIKRAEDKLVEIEYLKAIKSERAKDIENRNGFTDPNDRALF